MLFSEKGIENCKTLKKVTNYNSSSDFDTSLCNTANIERFFDTDKCLANVEKNGDHSLPNNDTDKALDHEKSDNDDEIEMIKNIKKMKMFLVKKRDDCEVYLNNLDSLEQFTILHSKKNAMNSQIYSEFENKVKDFFMKSKI